MCREQAALARTEMEYSLTKYWLAEAEEWKELRQAVPFKAGCPIQRENCEPLK